MGDLIEEGEVRDMTPRLVGEVYRKFTNGKDKQKRTFGIYECPYCGKEFETMVQNVKTGLTKGCGCQRKGINKTHGFSYHNFYTTWNGMLSRCNNPRSVNYKYYGERGITVCTEWHNPKAFLDWCDKTYIKGYTLDRIDNDKGYSPENCRWTDKTAQAMNRGISKRNKSGYIGVSWNKVRGMWTIRIKIKTKYECLGHFDDLMEAVIFRDNYIIENKLPHKLNLKQEKINE